MRPVLGLIFASCAIRIVRETRPHRDDGDGKRGTRFYKYDDDVFPGHTTLCNGQIFGKSIGKIDIRNLNK